MQIQTAQAGQLTLFPIGRRSSLDLIPASSNIHRLQLLRFCASPVQPFPYVRFGVAVAQAVQPDRAIRSGRLNRRVLHVSPALDRIAPLLQSLKKGLQGEGVGKRRINVLPDQPAHGGLAVLLGVPLGVMLGCAFWLNDGQIVSPAEVIGVTSNISEIEKYNSSDDLTLIELLYYGFFGAGNNVNWVWLKNNDCWPGTHPLNFRYSREQFDRILREGNVNVENVIVD